MSKVAGAVVVGLLALPMMAAAQSQSELDIGWLDYSDGTITQKLCVLNNDRLPIKAVKISCHFFSDTNLLNEIGAGSVQIQNIAPSGAGYETLSVASKTPANSATCHIVSVER